MLLSSAAFSQGAWELTGLSQECAVLADKVYRPRNREAQKSSRLKTIVIDFEDGYGYRSDAEEDGHAQWRQLWNWPGG
jgi:hypothetical protein